MWGVILLGIVLSVIYIGMPTYKKTLEEYEALKTKVVQLEQDNKTVTTEYENYKRNYSEDTVKIVEPVVLPNGSLAIDGQGKAVYRTSITHKKNIIIQDEKSKETIINLTSRLYEANLEISKLKKLSITKRDIRRVMGILSNAKLESGGLWLDTQTLGPIWAGFDVISPNITSLKIKDINFYLRVGYGF
jgi:hypothetical protein